MFSHVDDVFDICVHPQAMRKSKVLLDRAVDQCNQEALIQVGKLFTYILLLRSTWYHSLYVSFIIITLYTQTFHYCLF